MLKRIWRDEEGLAMVVSMMVAFVVLLLATVIFGQSIHTSGMSAYGRNRLTAVDAAEAGLNYWYNYIDQTKLWVRGETLPWAYSKGAVEAARKHALTFTKPDS